MGADVGSGMNGRGLSLLAALLVGCVAQEGPPREDPSEQVAEAGAREDVPGRYLGVLTVEGGAEILLCDGTPVGVDGPAFLEMMGLHSELTPGVEPLEGIFVDLLGELREDAEGPWLYAIALRRAAREGWGCGAGEGALLLEASGTEPFWILSVQDSVATWRTPEGAERFVHAGPYTMERGGWAVEGAASDGRGSLDASFYQEPCRNQMSGAWSHLSVEVVRDDRTLRGCGFVGPGAEGAF